MLSGRQCQIGGLGAISTMPRWAVQAGDCESPAFTGSEDQAGRRFEFVKIGVASEKGGIAACGGIDDPCERGVDKPETG